MTVKIRLKESHIINESYLRWEIVHWLDEEFKSWGVEYNRDSNIWWLILTEYKHAVYFRMKW